MSLFGLLAREEQRGQQSNLHRVVTKRRVGILIAIAGVLACVLVAFADPLGLGHDGLGPKKDALLGIGALLIIIGLVIVVRSRRSGPLEEMHHMRG